MAKAIIVGIRTGLHDHLRSCAADIRSRVKQGFNDLEAKVTGSISEEIAIIDASLQAILDKKRQQEYSAKQERQKLQETRDAIQSSAQDLIASLART